MELILTETGNVPTFSGEAYSNGMQGRIKHSNNLWTTDEA